MTTETLASSQAPPDLRSLSSLTDSDTEELDDFGTMKNTAQWLIIVCLTHFIFERSLVFVTKL